MSLGKQTGTLTYKPVHICACSPVHISTHLDPHKTTAYSITCKVKTETHTHTHTHRCTREPGLVRTCQFRVSRDFYDLCEIGPNGRRVCLAGAG